MKTRNWTGTALISLALALSSGGSEAADTKADELSSTERAASVPVGFEVRDFIQEGDKRAHQTALAGRGTVVTRDERLSKGHAVVWIRGEAGARGDPIQSPINLLDGVGALRTASEQPVKSDVPTYAWSILGYYKWQPAIYVDRRTAIAGESAPSEQTIPRVEIRDYSESRSASNGDISVVGMGTVVALDESLKSGLHVLRVQAHIVNSKNAVRETVVVLRDGVGTVRIYFYQTKEGASKGEPYVDRWVVDGYVPVMPGVIVTSAKRVGGSQGASGHMIELKDFVVERKNFVGPAKNVRARGTLVAKSGDLKKGNVVVWLKFQRIKGEYPTFAQVLLQDGIATISFSGVEFNDDPNTTLAFSDWSVEGILRLEPGVIIQQSPQKGM